MTTRTFEHSTGTITLYLQPVSFQVTISLLVPVVIERSEYGKYPRGEWCDSVDHVTLISF